MILRASIRLDTPVAISRRRATGNDLDTQPFLPGSTIRGAIAAAYLESGKSAEDAAFKTMFLKTPASVQFGDYRIGGCLPWPMSARQCREEPLHAFDDILLAMGAGAHIRDECGDKGCDSKREAPSGYYWFNSETERYETLPVETRRVAHCEIDAELLRAKNGQFHSARVISRGQIFEGRIWADEEGGAALHAFAGQERTLYLGRGRTRGQGRVTLRLEGEESSSVEDLLERVRGLNEKAQQFVQLRNQIVFSCTLNSAAVLLDEWLLSRNQLEATDISESLQGYKRLAALNQMVEVAGWNACAGLPKAGVAAIGAGSCFLFGTEAPGDRKTEYSKLAALFTEIEQRGIGERREEGFGEVMFCAPFHWTRAEAA